MAFSRYIDVFVGVSKYTVDQIIKDFGGQVRTKSIVIYNGIEYQRFKQREERSVFAPKFLVACHLRYSKGVQDLIDAVTRLPIDTLLKLKIDIYGDGEYKKILEKKILESQLQDVFTFKGSVSNLYEIYFQYDYLLQPTHMECFSLAILESLSANVPVVTTPVGGNEEVIVDGENGYILPVQNPQVWSIFLQKLFTGEQKILTTTSNLIINEFSIEKMVENYLNLT